MSKAAFKQFFIMKNIIITIAAIVVIIGGLIWLSASSKQNNDSKNTSNNGSLVLEENSFDFGSISMAAGKVDHVFRVKNETSDSAMIEQIYTSCMCTSAYLVQNGKEMGPFGMAGHGFIPKINQTVASGKEVEVKVVFDPAAHGPAGVGTIDRIVYVEQVGKTPLEIEIKATVTP